MTDQQLLEQLKQDNKAAFGLIYEQYWLPLLTTATKVLRSAEDAADVVQDVFLSLWYRRYERKVEGSLQAYLHTSARYKAINFIEKNINRNDYLLLLQDLMAHQVHHSPEAAIQIKQLQGAIANVVSGMPPKMQQAYRLSREQHLTHKQIAETMGIAQETVKKHIQHALDMIRIVVQDHSLAIACLFGGSAVL